jgi:hypothetical protein
MTVEQQLKQAKSDLNHLIVRGDDDAVRKKREEIYILEQATLELRRNKDEYFHKETRKPN